MPLRFKAILLFRQEKCPLFRSFCGTSSS